jgi:uncharacterized protein
VPPPRVDANIVLRYLTDEPAEQAERVACLFTSINAGSTEILLEDIVLAEVVWTLASFYQMTRREIAAALLRLLAEDGIHTRDKNSLQSALVLFSEKNIDFADALLAARALSAGEAEIYSFDRDFDRIPGIRRREPNG